MLLFTFFIALFFSLLLPSLSVLLPGLFFFFAVFYRTNHSHPRSPHEVNSPNLPLMPGSDVVFLSRQTELQNCVLARLRSHGELGRQLYRGISVRNKMFAWQHNDLPLKLSLKKSLTHDFRTYLIFLSQRPEFDYGTLQFPFGWLQLLTMRD